MYILAIETTGPFCSVALVNDEGLFMEKSSEEEMNHLQGLLPLTQQLLDEAGVEKTQLTHVAASVGPGSFTGIRIGVSTARALGQALNLPLVAVPTLEAFKFKDVAAMQIDTQDGVICAIINARRGQVYGIVEDYMEAGPYMLTDVLKVITEEVRPSGRPVYFYGDGIDAYEEKINEILGEAGMKLQQDYFFAPTEVRYQNALSVGKMAMEEAFYGEELHYNDLHPEYMRKAEAQQKREAGQLPICKGPKQE